MPPDVVRNCWWKAGFATAEDSAIDSLDNRIDDGDCSSLASKLHESLHSYAASCKAAVGVTADEYIVVDDNVMICSELMTDHIVKAIKDGKEAKADKDSSDEEPAGETRTLTTSEAITAFNTL